MYKIDVELRYEEIFVLGIWDFVEVVFAFLFALLAALLRAFILSET